MKTPNIKLKSGNCWYVLDRRYITWPMYVTLKTRFFISNLHFENSSHYKFERVLFQAADAKEAQLIRANYRNMLQSQTPRYK